MEITLVIPGTPIAQKRPRFARRGKFVTTYSDQQTEAGKFILLAQSQLDKHSNLPGSAPIRLTLTFFFPWPASVSKRKRTPYFRHVKRPDLSNCVKFVEDCLNVVMWDDDRQIDSILARKFYADSPSTVITVNWD